jgi:ribonuclease BN (tRNA processing enzyme)
MLITDAQLLPRDIPEKRGWGHSTVPEALQLGRAAQPLCQVLFHHDPDRNDDQLDIIAEQAGQFGVEEFLRGEVIVAREGTTFDLSKDSCSLRTP